MRAQGVQALLMGGQACVLYGGAEFSRDTDLAILLSTDNLERLGRALADLDAGVVAVPPFREEYLAKGHAVHFRCRHPEAEGMRVDIMSVMRGVAPFAELWARRTTIETGDAETIDLLALPDLVAAKKTQRDKDWPMIRRLLEAHYLTHRGHDETDERVRFWLQELRTAVLLIETAGRHAAVARTLSRQRPMLGAALDRNIPAIEDGLLQEQQREREQDRAYWQPLREELQRLRQARRAGFA